MEKGKKVAHDETACLTANPVNAQRLQDAIDVMSSGIHFNHQLIEFDEDESTTNSPVLPK